MFQTFSLKSKLLLLCLTLSTVSVLVGFTAYVSLGKVSKKYDHVAVLNLPNIIDAGEMLAEFRQVRIGLRTLGIKGVLPAQGNEAIKSAKEAMDKYDLAAKAYLEKDFMPGEKELYSTVAENWDKFKLLGTEVIRLYQSGKTEDLERLNHIFFNECPEAAGAYFAAINKLIEFHQNDAHLSVKEAKSEAVFANWLVLAIVFGGTCIGMLVGWLFSNSISRTINNVAGALAEGAGRVGVVAEDVASASQKLSASTTEQAAALQETTAAIDQTSSMVSKNAENAQRSAQVSESSRGTVDKGKKIVSEMIDSIGEVATSNGDIMRQVEESYREISDIVKLIAEIGNKTKVINDIVFQTKLLSFNASVEAARAGEHGKGFAVVAEEVGNLAQMSGNSAKEISQMLESSIQKVEQIVTNSKGRVERLMQVGKEKVDVSTTTAKRCREVLDEVVANVTEVGGMVNEIAAACKEQAQGVQEITKAMAQLDQVGQQNNTSSQQAASSADDLKVQVEKLNHMVNMLNQAVSGKGNTPPGSPPAVTSEKAKVLSFPKAAGPANTTNWKMAAGAEKVPSQTDSRFEEV